VFAMVPTWVAIMGSPRYFFRKLPLIANGGSPIYPSPVNFVWDVSKFMAASGLMLLGMIGSSRLGNILPHGLSYRSVLLWVLALAVTAPLWLIPIAFVTQVAFMFTPRVLAPLHNWITRRVFRPALTIVAMSTATYRLLDWKAYATAFLYFGLYSVPIVTIAFVITCYIVIANEVLDEIARIQLYWLLPVGIVLQVLLLRPYVYLLVYSVKLPTVWMHQASVSRLDKLLPKSEEIKPRDFKLIPYVLREWESLRAQFMYEERLAYQRNPFFLVQLMNLRAATFSTLRMETRLNNLTASADHHAVSLARMETELARVTSFTPLVPRYRSAAVESAIGLDTFRATVEGKRQKPRLVSPEPGAKRQILICPHCRMKVWPNADWHCPSCLKSMVTDAEGTVTVT